MLDQPTLGLDRSAQEGLPSALSALRTSGRCVVVATHTTELIQTADRVLVLDKGRVVADAPPSRLLSPANNAMPARTDRAAAALVDEPARRELKRQGVLTDSAELQLGGAISNALLESAGA